MGAAATALSTILGRRVEITVPRVEVINKEKWQTFFGGTYY